MKSTALSYAKETKRQPWPLLKQDAPDPPKAGLQDRLVFATARCYDPAVALAIHGEPLRVRFVAHQGRIELMFKCRGWVEGSPENAWPEAFASWAGQIRDHVGPQVHDALICDFSTTGPVERAVSQIVLIDVFERHFK